MYTVYIYIYILYIYIYIYIYISMLFDVEILISRCVAGCLVFYFSVEIIIRNVLQALWMLLSTLKIAMFRKLSGAS